MENNLYRSSDEKLVAGVCAGLAHHFDLNKTGLRWVFALVTIFFSGLPLIAYVILWAMLKERTTKGVIEVRT
jgi:phage shock protein PspC (stress-responsive transcriptional regulator)